MVDKLDLSNKEDEEKVIEILREFYYMGNLNHPNLVKCYGYSITLKDDYID